MKLVTLGILAVLLCAGCAMQAGDPAAEEEGVAEGVPLPTKPVQRDSSNGGKQSNPEPSPWHGENTTPATNSSSSGGTATNPNAMRLTPHDTDKPEVGGELIQPL